MKREIWCPKCSQGHTHSKVRMHPDDIRMGVEVHAIGGTLKTDARCDVCAVLLLKNYQAVAITISDRSHPYAPWESDYLETKGKK